MGVGSRGVPVQNSSELAPFASRDTDGDFFVSTGLWKVVVADFVIDVTGRRDPRTSIATPHPVTTEGSDSEAESAIPRGIGMPEETKGPNPVSPPEGGVKPPAETPAVPAETATPPAVAAPKPEAPAAAKPVEPASAAAEKPAARRASRRTGCQARSTGGRCQTSRSAQTRRAQTGALGFGTGHASSQPVWLRDSRGRHLSRAKVFRRR